MVFAQSLGEIAPLYNLALALLVLFHFVRLFKVSKRWSIVRPWFILFCAFLIYIVEEMLTVLRITGVIPQSLRWMNGIFEMAIIALFIYVLLCEHQRFAGKGRRISQ